MTPSFNAPCWHCDDYFSNYLKQIGRWRQGCLQIWTPFPLFYQPANYCSAHFLPRAGTDSTVESTGTLTGNSRLRRPADFTPCITSSVSCGRKKKNKILIMCVEHSVAALQVYLYACSGVRSKQGREEQRQVQSVYSAARKKTQNSIFRTGLFIFQSVKTYPRSCRQLAAPQTSPDSPHRHQTAGFMRRFNIQCGFSPQNVCVHFS